MVTLRQAAVIAVLGGSALIAGCTNDRCDPHVTNEAVVRRPAGDPEIDACVTKKNCVPLCADVFDVPASIISDCRIFDIDLNHNITLRVRIDDAQRCVGGGDDVYLDWGDGDDAWDGWYPDDSCDDGSCDDGGNDTGDDDGGMGGGDDDDGGMSGDDDGGDTGGDDDDGGGDDDDSRVIRPHHAPSGQHAGYKLAPRI